MSIVIHGMDMPTDKPIALIINPDGQVSEVGNFEKTWKATALERDRWISVEERLPEENGYYLVKVCSPHIPVRAYEYKPDREWGGFDTLWKGYDGSYVFDHFVTHWMPLPEPPKEG